jgi:hypothetical protein
LVEFIFWRHLSKLLVHVRNFSDGLKTKLARTDKKFSYIFQIPDVMKIRSAALETGGGGGGV